MSNEDEILLEFEAVIRVKKDGTVEMKPKAENNGSALKQSKISAEDKVFARSSSYFACIQGQWHWCIDDGVGGEICWPLGYPC